jgi:hypothetical protein
MSGSEQAASPDRAAPRRHAAFVIPHPYVDALACFREPIRYLAGEGWDIDLYTTLSPLHPAPFFGRENIRTVPLRISRPGALDLLRRLTLRQPPYDYIVTVPQWGLHYSGIAARLAGIPMGCISDELRSGAEAATPGERRWKARERRAHQQCAWTIALSEDRAAFVRTENQLGADHPIFVVPNAVAGPSRRLVSRYFHDALRLPSERRVLLHAGSFWWKSASDLLRATASWSGDWIVVFQGRFAQRNGWHDTEHARIAADVLPSSLLDYAVSSACIGLALYDDTGANNRLMGTASGKVSLYMKNGLPVIATRAGGFDWLEREGCGVCISGIEDIPAAADRIWARYGEYARAAQRYYDDKLEFAARFDLVARLMAGG